MVVVSHLFSFSDKFREGMTRCESYLSALELSISRQPLFISNPLRYVALYRITAYCFSQPPQGLT